MNIKKKKLFVVFLTFLFLSFLTAAGYFLFYKKQIRHMQKDGSKIAATIFPLYDIVKNVAGQEVETILILAPGASPHTFDPSPQEIRELRGSKAVFAIGHGLDDWSIKLAQSAGVERIINVDKNIKLLKNTQKSYGKEEAEHKYSEIDPHYWLSVINAKLIAKQAKDELSELFPEKAQAFENNFVNYETQLDTLNRQTNQALSSLENKDIATFHSAWNYFARDHGINIVATFEEFPGEQPTPKYLAEFQEKIKNENVNVIFSEPQFSTIEVKPIANDLGVKISILDPIGGVEDRSTYIELIRFNTSQLQKFLK